jgi:hypothetical protein
VVEGANDLTGQGSVYTRRVAADEDMMVRDVGADVTAARSAPPPQPVR